MFRIRPNYLRGTGVHERPKETILHQLSTFTIHYQNFDDFSSSETYDKRLPSAVHTFVLCFLCDVTVEWWTSQRSFDRWQILTFRQFAYSEFAVSIRFTLGASFISVNLRAQWNSTEFVWFCDSSHEFSFKIRETKSVFRIFPTLCLSFEANADVDNENKTNFS